MTTDRVGGVWSYATDMASRLAERGFDVTLAVLGPALRTDPVPSGTPGVTVLDTGLPLDWLAEDEDTVAIAGRALVELAGRFEPDVIHLNSPAFAAYGPFDAPVVGVCHSCLATWWRAVHAGDVPPALAWRSAVLASGYAACDRLIAPSRSFADMTAAQYGVRPAVVRNGRSGAPLAAGTKEPFVFTSGRFWDLGKNIQALDQAAGRMQGEVRAAGPLCGPDGRGVALQTVKSLGTLSAAAMTAYLDRAAVFASLAFYEPFGLGVLEAAQAGCALVLSDIPTFRELWSDAAVFVAADDAPGVAAVLDGLLEQPMEAARWGRLARARAASFGVDAMVDGTVAAYGLQQPARPRMAEAG